MTDMDNCRQTATDGAASVQTPLPPSFSPSNIAPSTKTQAQRPDFLRLLSTTIKKMTEKLYTYVPILEDGKLVGVFSENTLLDIVNLESGIIIDEETKFDSIKSALMIENHSMEDFVFVARNKNVYDIELLFKDYFSRNKILGCIYVTENGKRDEQILGMLTAWDVLGNSN